MGTVLATLLAWCSSAFALNPELDISQYGHTAWTIREGSLSGQVLAIAQTPDGYLWLGTETGLYRFDGARIVYWQPREDERLPSPAVAELLVARDGRLWIGTYAGLASLKGGRLVTYPEVAGEAVGSLVEDSLGTVWVGTIAIPHGRLCAIRDGVRCSTHDGRFGNSVVSLFDDRGALWLAAQTGLWRWTAANPTRYATPISSVKEVLGASDRPLLIATTDGVKQLVDEKLETYRIEGIDRSFQANKLLLDRDGGLWIGTFRKGLIHVHQGRADVFFPSDGLSGDSINAVFEDRERNIWVGTNEGLDRFRELPVTTVSSRQGLPSDSGVSVLPARDGSVWIGSSVGVSRWKDGRTTTYTVRDGLPDNRAGTMFEDSTGRVLVATLGGMAAFDNGRFIHLKSVPTRVVYDIVEERAGSFWISDQERGLLHLVGEVVTPIPWSTLGHSDHATALALDRARRGLWLGFYNGGIAFVQDGTVSASYGTADGLAPGRISELRLDADGALWAATAGGLTRLKDNHVATLTTAHGLPCEAVHWTILDPDRMLWLLMPCGLARIGSTELAAWVADPNRTVTSTLFDASDGVRALSTPIGFNPAVARLTNGHLWFATANGVGTVDPRHLSLNALPPPVHIEQLVADRKTYSTTMTADEGPRLPPLTRDLQIDYTAVSLVAPEKVRFRYKLEGRDRDWQDVGNRRQAFYNDLGPGSYRFRVVASNDSGVWNETGASLAFVVAPAYYQTTWFPILIAAIALALVFGAHRLRLRIVEKHEREISALNERLMKAQEQERIRIAGELHDGVMQEMLAATMMVGSAKRRVTTNPADAAATMDKVQEKLVQVGSGIRQLSHDLHPPALQAAGLPDAMRTYCEEFSASSGIAVSCDADDSARELSRGAALALFRIVQEALGNAAKHAAAKHIIVRLTRADGYVSLTVSDDGVGFDRSQLGTSGGLGLIMMRERASQLNGTFEFESAPGRGTTIKVVIPFR